MQNMCMFELQNLAKQMITYLTMNTLLADALLWDKNLLQTGIMGVAKIVAIFALLL